MIFTLLISHVFASQEISIALLTSQYTKAELRTEFEANLEGLVKSIENSFSLTSPILLLWEELDLVNFKGTWSMSENLAEHDVSVFIDTCNYPIFTQYLSSLALKNNWLHIVADRPLNSIIGETVSRNTFFTYPNFTVEAISVKNLIFSNHWENLGLIYDQQVNNIQMAKKFKTLIPGSYIKDELILDTDDAISYITLSRRLESTTRNSGARIIVVFSNPVLAGLLLRAADEVVMGSSGYAWIFNSEAMCKLGEIARNSHADIPRESYGILKTGAVGIMASDEEYLKEQPLGNIHSIISLVVSGLLKGLGKEGLRSYFLMNDYIDSLPYQLHFDSSGLKQVNYDLYNLKNFAATKVAAWDLKTGVFQMDQSKTIIWPGLGKKVPDDNVPIIKVCFLYPKTNFDGSINLKGLEAEQGFSLAISEINNSTELIGDYDIEVIFKDTLQSTSLAGVTVKSLASFNVLAYIGPDSDDLAKSYSKALSAYLDPKPLVSYLASDYLLSDSTVYPRFLRTVQPDGLQAVAIAMQINVLAWKKIAVLYSDDLTGQGIYTSFQNNMNTLEIEIVNKESKRSLTVGLNQDGTLTQKTKDRIDEVLSEIVRQQGKVIVYLGNPALTPQIAKVAYQKELHGKDYCWMGSMWITESVLQQIETLYKDDQDDIFKIINGALGLTHKGIQGDIGNQFAQTYLGLFGKNYSTEALLAYDSAYLLGYTIKGMISRGEDFNSGKELTDSLRSADFTGASGKIKFSEGTNDRSAFGFSVINVQDKKIVRVQEYNPLDPSMFQNVSNSSIVYGDGAKKAPSDTWSKSYDCPFAEHMSSVSITGVIIVLCVGLALLLITLVLSYFSYKKWREVPIEEIEKKVTRNWKDTMSQVQIFVEFFQFIAIAPTFQSLKLVIQAASNIFMLDVMKVAQSSKSDYWILLSVVCGLCYSWSILVALIMANAENWLRKVPLCQRLLSVMNALYLPFFGNTMFLPALALLLDVLVCDHQAQGKAYVWRDCYVNCWEGEHIPYLVMAILAIIFYEPVAVFSRPLWQQAKTGLNIKIKPIFLLFKTCIQILLIAVGKSLQGISPLSHAIVFSVIFITFTVVTYKIRPFNYNRCNLWEVISLMMVSYLSVLATLSYVGNQTHVAWFVCLIIGWSIMGAAGLFIQKKKMPNLLISPSDKDNKIIDYNPVKHLGINDHSQDMSDLKDYKEEDNKIEIPKIVSPSGDVIKIRIDEENHVEEDNHRNSDNEDIDADEEAQPIN
jgi:ABC-type branched-subunit amino acid transport system substrate-binding protein